MRLVFETNGKRIYSTTDENGEFEALLPAGEYKLTASQTISENFVSYIKIQETGLNPDNVEYMVNLSRNCCQTKEGIAFPRAINIPKPIYPPAARAVHVMGEIIVNVKIDKEGKVSSAQAISGHPLIQLRQAAVSAAMQSLFEASENVPEREANLTYVFLLPTAKSKEIKHYLNPYRIEIISPVPVLNY